MAPVAPAAPEVPRIIVPGAPAGASGAPLILPQGSIIIAVPSTVIIPQAPVILAPPPLIVPASRPLSEAEAAQTKAPSQEELQKLVAGLSSRDESSPNAHAAGGAFDGSAAAEPRAVLDISYFGSQPLAPSLSKVEDAARAVMGHLLPRFYRPIPSASAYADDKITGHTWTPDNGHLIELSPVAADSSGEVPSAFGFPGAVRVQQRIERFMEYSHELAHVLFDDGVRKTQTHSPRSAYAAMTEGFAVALEQILIERMLAQPVALHLSPRDAMDLAAISRARTQWLASMDTHYSEGILSWRKAYERGGETGMLTLLSSLSSRRMTDTMRSDPLYQLTLGDPTLLSPISARNGTDGGSSTRGWWTRPDPKAGGVSLIGRFWRTKT